MDDVLVVPDNVTQLYSDVDKLVDFLKKSKSTDTVTFRGYFSTTNTGRQVFWYHAFEFTLDGIPVAGTEFSSHESSIQRPLGLLSEWLHKLAYDCEIVASLMTIGIPPGHVNHVRAKLLRDEAEMRIKPWAAEIDAQIAAPQLKCASNLDELKHKS